MLQGTATAAAGELDRPASLAGTVQQQCCWSLCICGVQRLQLCRWWSAGQLLAMVC
jgi:hypothetical protein